MSNGYHEGLACEHEFLHGPPCDAPAVWITPAGHGFCQSHFEAVVSGQSVIHRTAFQRDSKWIGAGARPCAVLRV